MRMTPWCLDFSDEVEDVMGLLAVLDLCGFGLGVIIGMNS